MKFYFILTLTFLLSIYSISSPNAFSLTNQNNSMSYYERTCDNYQCQVTTCYAGQPCSTIESNDTSPSSTNALKQLPGVTADGQNSRSLNFFGLLKDFMNFS